MSSDTPKNPAPPPSTAWRDDGHLPPEMEVARQHCANALNLIIDRYSDVSLSGIGKKLFRNPNAVHDFVRGKSGLGVEKLRNLMLHIDALWGRLERDNEEIEADADQQRKTAEPLSPDHPDTIKSQVFS